MPTIDELLDRATPRNERPASADSLRATLRRRRRTRVGSGLAACLLAVGGFGVYVNSQNDGGQPVDVVTSQPENEAEPAPSADDADVAPPDSGSIEPGSAGDAEDEPIGEALGSPLGRLNGVVASRQGVALRRSAAPADLVVITQDEAAAAFLLPDGAVVYQRALPDETTWRVSEGPIEVVGGGLDELTISAPDGFTYDLHDAREVDGRLRVLVSQWPSEVFLPPDAEHRLLDIDVASGEATDLGQFAGWESGLSEARFLADGISLVRSSHSYWTAVIEFDGTLRFGRDHQADDDIAMVAVDVSVLWEIRSRFVGDDFSPVLDITEVDATTGDELGSQSLTLSGVEVGAGFCHNPQLIETTLVCDTTEGLILAIDTETGSTQTVEGIDEGTLWLELPELRTGETLERGSEIDASPDPDPVTEAGAGNCVVLKDTTPTPLGMFASGLDDDDMSISAMLDATGEVRFEVTIDGKPGGPMHEADLDGDGVVELFFGFGNTARNAKIFRFDGCTLNEVADETGQPAWILFGVGGNSCAPVGCQARVRCINEPTGLVIETSLSQPVGVDITAEPLPDPNDVTIEVTVERFRLIGNTLELVDASIATTYEGVDQVPAAPPQQSDIDC